MFILDGSLVLLTTLVVGFASPSRILVVLPIPFRDHQTVFRPLVEDLAKRGHNLTVLTTDPLSFATGNDYIDLIDLSFAHNLKILDKLKEYTGSGLDVIRNVFDVTRYIAEAELKSPQVQELLRDSSRTFDAVLIDWSGPSLMNAFAWKFQVPLIGITPGSALTTSHEAMGNPNHPTSFPSVLLPFSDNNLSLFQRIASAFFSLKYRYLYFNEELPIQHEIAKDYFGQDFPDLWDIECNADLLLINSYEALGNSRPVSPTTILLGGIHAKQERQSLPSDLKKFMDNSYSGVVYINLDSATLRGFIETERLEKLISVLENLNMAIVWNLNYLPFEVNMTGRLYQSSFISQEDVLAHPNTRLFITTGSQRDIEDAIHHTIPVLGFSFSSTLEHYLLQIERYDVGIVSHFDLEPATTILIKIEEIVQNDMYKLNMLRLNQLVTDAPQTPRDRAIWWIEYVIRYGGTDHLKSSWAKLSWFQYLLLDVILTITVTTTIIVTAIIIAILKIRKYSKSLPVELVTRRAKKLQ